MKFDLLSRPALVAFVSGAALAFPTASQTRADDWPQWRGPQRNGISAEKGWSAAWPAEGPKLLWKASVGIGYASMSVSGGRLFTIGNTDDVDTVYCLDAQTGAVLWRHSYPCSPKDPNGFPGTRCTPTVDGDRVFTVGRQGQFFCLNKADGKVVWAKDFAKDFGASVPDPGTKEWWGYAGSPLVEGNLVIFETGASSASLVACDKATGKVVWKNGGDEVGYSSAVAFTHNGRRAVAILSAAGLVGRSAKDGAELWRHPWKTSYNVNAATPVIDGDQAFISAGYGHGCALVQFGGDAPRVVWENKNMRNHVNSSVLWQGHLYGFDEKELRCLDWATGQVKWSNGSFGKGSVILADGKLILFSDTGRVAVAEASPAAFKEICGAQVLGGKNTWVAPVLAQGRLYCRSMENLVCLDVKP